MKIFLSWSGLVSKQVATILREWLRNVIQAVEPWMSDEDIEKGSRWSAEIAAQLKNSKAGIICITSDNHNAPWLNFEAGAISKAVDNKEMVCTFLFDLKPSDLTGPLTQFQATQRSREDLRRLVDTLNKGVESNRLSESRLTEAFDLWWPKLELKLNAIAGHVPSKDARRPTEEMIEEILTISRDQAKTLQNLFATVHQLRVDDAIRNTYPYGIIKGFTPITQVAGGSSLLTSGPLGIADLLSPGNLQDYNPPMEDASVDGGTSDEEGPIRPE